MGYLVSLAIDGRTALVVGGGVVAARKIGDLLDAGAIVTVVSPSACDEVRRFAEEKRIAARWREYRGPDMEGVYLAVAATDSEAVNAEVDRDACALGILVNVVDRPAMCSFTVPATVRRGKLSFAVSTDGACPAFAGVLREELGRRYGPEYAELTAVMAELRERMLALGWEGRRIREAIKGLWSDGIAEAIAAGDRRRVRDLVEARLGAK